MQKRVYISSIFFIFSFFFVSPVLSPSIKGNTIYLNWFIPFLDVYFIRRMMNIQIKIGAIIGFLIFAIIVFLHSNYMLMFKALSIIFSVLYLQYAYKKIGFRQLYKAFNINIFIAILQFTIYLIDRRAAYFIGPNYLSRLIWGSFATETNTNFYPIFILPRTCGLSREAGFFSALLCIIIIIYISDKNIKKTQLQKLLFIIAYIISFSKMSIVLPIMFIVFHNRKRINKIPLVIMVALFIITTGMFVNSLNRMGFFYLAGESFTHRLWGYGVTFNHLSNKEFLIGNAKGTQQLNQEALNAFPYIFILERIYKILWAS